MVTYVEGDIFASPMKTITSPVNCKGIQGAGLAKAFKHKYIVADAAYRQACNSKQLVIGKPLLWVAEDEGLPGKNVLFFPTKDDWRNATKETYIRQGLEGLIIMDLDKIESLALPALGCGLGGMQWSLVKPLMEEYLNLMPIDVEVYLPN